LRLVWLIFTIDFLTTCEAGDGLLLPEAQDPSYLPYARLRSSRPVALPGAIQPDFARSKLDFEFWGWEKTSCVGAELKKGESLKWRHVCYNYSCLMLKISSYLILGIEQMCSLTFGSVQLIWWQYWEKPVLWCGYIYSLEAICVKLLMTQASYAFSFLRSSV
jgi:hypothetical protein